MSALAGIAFLSPLWLAALAALPILWWLLRVTPPAPRRALFPAIRLQLALKPKEETPAQEIDEQDLKNCPARIESRAHGRRQSSGLQHGCWMDVPPPANRKPHNRRVHKGDDPEYR